jgi:hypothetical protein
MTKETNSQAKAKARTKAISETLENLASLCKTEPQASIICSIYIPNKDSEKEKDAQVISIYAGDTISHIQQLDLLAENEPQFLSDLTMFLDLRIKKQIAKAGTTGNTAIDQILAKEDQMAKEDQITKINQTANRDKTND